MATYGKKKRSFLQSLSVLRDSDVTSKAKQKALKKRESLLPTMSPFLQDSQSGEFHRDDSIGEMASMLLDDMTEDQLKTDPGRRLSQISAAETPPNLAHAQADDYKLLPHLPKLIFNGDDAWAMKTAPVVTAAGNSNSIYFGHSGDSNRSTLPIARAHSRNGSAPAIPRKSSKRKSVRPKSTHAKAQFEGDRKKALKSSISPPKLLEPIPPQQLEPPDVNNKIQAMLAATKALKAPAQAQTFGANHVNNRIQTMLAATKAMKGGTDQTLLQGPYLPANKRRLMGNKVLANMKTAINDRLQVRNPRRRDSARDDRLLDPSNSELEEWEEPLALSALEIRLNEGQNFENPKVFNLTGHGVVRRKPVADDGKSLRSIKSRQSAEDSFLGGRHPSVLTRTPTSFEKKLGVDMPLDQSSAFIPDLPKIHNHTPKKELSRSQNPKQYLSGSDIDALLSSSPQAQSTPRIRLEPSFEENGRKTLKNVLADSRSVFDFDPDSSYVGQSPNMAIDSEQADKAVFVADSAKRKNSRSALAGDGKRSKKHPSPSKEELERLELAMKNFPLDARNEAPFANATARGTLSSKDANGKLKAAKRTEQGKVAFSKQELTKTTESMPNLGAKGFKSAKRKPPLEKRAIRQRLSQNNIADANMMDLDELQWDKTEYNIGMRRV